MELQPNEVASWAFEDTVVDGRVTIDKPSKKLLRAVAAAESAGVLTVKASKDERAVMADAVESDAESLKAQQKAQADGSWQRGNHEAFLTSATLALADEELLPERREHLLNGIDQSRNFLETDG